METRISIVNRVGLLLVIALSFISCGNGTSGQPANAKGFANIEQELKSKFGTMAYYTDLKIIYIKGIGNTISTTVTEAPESLKMGEWDLSQNTWTQRSEVNIEIPEGFEAKDFMFQLNEKFSLVKLGELIERSIQQLKAEKDLKNPVLSLASINFPDNGDVSKAQYWIKLEPKQGGTDFNFYYTLDGELIKMNY